MKISRSDAKNRILNEVAGKLSKSVPKREIHAVTDFVRDFFLNVPVDDLCERSLEELASQTIQTWKFLQTYDRKLPKIAIVNPDIESSNWQAGHTIVMVLQKDMPFLSDSVRMEFSRNEIGVHAVQNVVQIATRDSRGKLKKRVRRNFDDVASGVSDTQALEAVLYFEIDRQAIIENEKHPLEIGLFDVLNDLQLVVDDFGSMKAKAMDIIKELELTPPPVSAAEVEEGKIFLQWLLDHNFTFLGYKEYKLTKGQKRTCITALPECSLGIVKRKQKSKHKKYLEALDSQAQQFVLKPQLLGFAKSGTLSRVHRPVYPDYVAFRRFNKKGEVIGERGFLGLYTLPVYTERIREIPVLRLKAQEIMRKSGLHPLSHEGKELARVLETYPRDELFQTDTDELYATASRISQIKERHQVKLFLRRDHFAKFMTCFVYMPREAYNTDTRKKIQALLCRSFDALNAEFNTYFGESVLVRSRFTLRTDPDKVLDYDIELLEREIGQIARSWQDSLVENLIVRHGEQRGLELAGMFREGFPSDYRENFSTEIAVADIARLECIEDDESLAIHLYQVTDRDSSTTRLALYHANTPIPLSDVIPIMENMGLHVTGEHPYKIRSRDESIFWKHDFQVIYNHGGIIDATEDSDRFTTAFTQVWRGVAGNDCFNKLVFAADAGWREVMLIRACAHYLKQIKLGLSRDFITETFLNNIAYTKLIVEYFKTKFDPKLKLSTAQRDGRLQKIEQKCLGLLENIAGLSEDLVLRRYLELCKSILRTNYFQPDERELPKEYMSFKLAPGMIPAVPQPVPMFEIFVFSERVEGLHLRAGKVARGGLRWSDRVEDYRTEVLGLVKAQQVKNAVIVPVGAKGGFIAKRASSMANRSDFLDEGISSYKIFISGLLDITDNLLLDKIVPPVNVLRYDEDDTYLVVAADKGTASFSDISNNIASKYEFWLGDAFASGGSRGYDHKGMGITARGAWISVQRHFRERGIDVQKTDFTVVGVGDMGGDVFGNGMLLSEHIKLLAAFNHLHIFIDPNPDPKESYTERQRLFNSVQSGWSEYDKQLISKGGGVFLRTAKSIDITAEMKKCFGIQAKALTPSELLKAILRAKVDLIWNGGIGTYVKSSVESDEDVGDRSNDAVRVNGKDIQAQVIGEGGNLGATQLGRIEFARSGGAINTDFIDNAGGVDCSDHEVNIKILLDKLVTCKKLKIKQRNQILVTMTDQVAELVLLNNYRQVQAISIAEFSAKQSTNDYRRFINDFVKRGKLNRELEYLPDEKELKGRMSAGQGLTRPELSVLISYAKADLKERMVDTSAISDPYVSRIIETAFPSYLRKHFTSGVDTHPLQKEIIATQLANEIVNMLGATFVWRTQEFVGASLDNVVTAYVLARDVFELGKVWEAIENLDNQVPASLQISALHDLILVTQDAIRWFLKKGTFNIDIASTVLHYRKGVQRLEKLFVGAAKENFHDLWKAKEQGLVAQNVPLDLATKIAVFRVAYFALDLVAVEDATGIAIEKIFQIYILIDEALGLDAFREQIEKIESKSQWHQMAREAFHDELDAQTRALIESLVAQKTGKVLNCKVVVEKWLLNNKQLLQRWRALQKEFLRSAEPDFALFSVAIRELSQLSQSGLEAAEFN